VERALHFVLLVGQVSESGACAVGQISESSACAVGQVAESIAYCASATFKFLLRLVTYYIGRLQVNDVLLFPQLELVQEAGGIRNAEISCQL
jgi:hypothetical protein